MNNPVKIPKLLWGILILFLAVSIFATVVAIRDPSGRSYPRIIAGTQGPKGDSVPVDYTKLAVLIHNEVISLGLTSGTNGVNGIGINGSNGQNVTPDQIATAVTAYLQANPPSPGKDGLPGADGAPGVAKNLVTRCVPGLNPRIDIKYDGDDIWQPFFFIGIGGSCP